MSDYYDDLREQIASAQARVTELDAATTAANTARTTAEADVRAADAALEELLVQGLLAPLPEAKDRLLTATLARDRAIGDHMQAAIDSFHAQAPLRQLEAELAGAEEGAATRIANDAEGRARTARQRRLIAENAVNAVENTRRSWEGQLTQHREQVKAAAAARVAAMRASI